jgi:predicted O-methyltransferase YrrM
MLRGSRNLKRVLRFVRNAAIRSWRSFGRVAASGDDVAELRQRVALYERGWAPGHFYSPIPSLAEVSRKEALIFAEPQRSLPGIDLHELDQLELLDRLVAFYGDHPFAGVMSEARFQRGNPNYSLAEAILLNCMVRRSQPDRIVEIGSGHSSCAILDINEQFFGDAISCTFNDPHPELLRSLLRERDEEHINIVERAVQDVDLSTFESLRAGDILFVDSTHVAKVGSDVNRIVFEVLPRLAEGVLVHFHDIYYPFEYPKEWVYGGRAWNEAYILRAFLEYNDRFPILFFNSFLGKFHAERLRECMPECAHPGSSLWLRVGRA